MRLSTILLLLAAPTLASATPLSSVVNGNTSGTYNLNGSTTYTGGLDLRVPMTINGNGARLVLSAGQRLVLNGSNIVLNDLRIEGGDDCVFIFEATNARVTGCTMTGGVNTASIIRSSATLQNCILQQATTFTINGESSTVTITGTEFRNANGGRGPQFRDCRLTLTNSSFRNLGDAGLTLVLADTSRDTTTQIDGCVFENAGSLHIASAAVDSMTIVNSTFTGSGTAVTTTDVPLTVRNSTFSGLGGNALVLQSGGTANAPVLLEDSTFGAVGALDKISGGDFPSLTVRRCTFTGAGKGIAIQDTTVTIENTVFDGVDPEAFTLFRQEPSTRLLRATLTDIIVRNHNRSNVPATVKQASFIAVTRFLLENSNGGLNLEGAGPSFESATIEDYATDATAFPRNQKQDGLLLLDLPNVTARNLSIRGHYIGTTVANSEALITDAVYYRNFHPAIVAKSQARLTMERVEIEGDLLIPGGQLGVDHWDAVYTDDSDFTLRDSIIIDAADNAINVFARPSYSPRTVVERCIILGANTLGINPQFEPNDAKPRRYLTVRDTTILNSRLAELATTQNTEALITYNVIGTTGSQAVSRNKFSEESKGLAFNTSGLIFRHNLIHLPFGSAINSEDVDSFGGAALIENNAVISGREGAQDGFGTRRLAFLVNSAGRTRFLRNDLSGSRPGAEGFIFDKFAAPAEMRFNHLGERTAYPILMSSLYPETVNAPDNYWGAAEGPRINGASTGGAQAFVPAGTLNFQPVVWPVPPVKAWNVRINTRAGDPFRLLLTAGVAVQGATSIDLRELIAGAMRYNVDPKGVLPVGVAADKVLGWWDVWVDGRAYHWGAEPRTVGFEFDLDALGVSASAANVRPWIWSEEANRWVRPRQSGFARNARMMRVSFGAQDRPRTILLARDTAGPVEPEALVRLGTASNVAGSDGVFDAADLIR